MFPALLFEKLERESMLAGVERYGAAPLGSTVHSIVFHHQGMTKVEARAIVGIGGGITLDAAKAVSNLLTNGGQAADYQGWDLVKVPGIFKVGVPRNVWGSFTDESSGRGPQYLLPFG